MNRFARLSCATLLCVAATPSMSHAQVVAERDSLLTPPQLLADFAVMRHALEESHVGLYWFISKRDLDRRFTGVAQQLVRSMSLREFHRVLLPLVAALRHGHTTLALPDAADGFRLHGLSRTGKYFPAEVRVLRDRLYVLTDLTADGSLPAGTEIIAINRAQARTLIDQMRSCLSADGRNDTYKLFQLGEGFQFNALLDVIAGRSTSFTVLSRQSPGKPGSVHTVFAQTPQQLAAQYAKRTGHSIDSFPPAVAFSIVRRHVGLLKVNSFYEGLLPKGSTGFAEQFATAFRQMRDSGVTSLILDVRENQGGNDDYVPLLYSYLANVPFQMASPTELASATLSWLQYADSPSNEVKAFAEAPFDFVSKDSNGTWLLKPAFDVTRYRSYEPQADRFAGQLVVLTGGGSFSATNAFLDLVHRYHRRAGRSVAFVGEQNGGDDTFGRVSGGQIVTLMLPNSRLALTIPLLGFQQYFGTATPTAQLPDFRVTPTIADLVAGRDRQLRFALKAIRH